MRKYFLPCFLMFFLTTVSKSQWSEQTSGLSNNLISVSAVDSNFVWICALNGRVLRTTNGGINWASQIINGLPTSIQFVHIFGIDSINCIATGSRPDTTYVYKTTNGGLNWSAVFKQAGGFIDAIWIGNDQNGFMIGDPVEGRWSLWKTSDAGNSWDSAGMYLAQYLDEAGIGNNLCVLGSNIWFGTGIYYHIYYSPNFGTNWSQQTAPGDTVVFGLHFNSITQGVCAMSLVYNTTTNGGTNWVNHTPPSFGVIYGITGSGNEYWYINQYITSGQIYYSSNNGESFELQYTPPAGYYNHITKARTGGNLWAVGYQGRISKYTPPNIGVISISNEVPGEFKLYQNYPNPFNPATKIQFQIIKTNNVKIVVFDLLGRECETLVNEKLKTGTYEVDLDGSNYSSGVYYYRIQAGSFTDTKKMILLK